MVNYVVRKISIGSLLLDQENARHGRQPDQNAILQWMATRAERSKLVKLAESIAENGLNPSELIIVVPVHGHEQKLWTVVEGNRRVAAIKMLSDPDKCPNEIMKKRLKDIVKKYNFVSPSEIDSVVFASFNDATYWIELRHLGEQGGAGTVGWGAKETDHFAQRIGKQGRYEPATRLADYVKRTGLAAPNEVDRIPITNLHRLINSPNVRRTLGLNMSRGQLTRVAPKEYVDRALAGLFSALGSGEVTVSDLKSKEQRETFITSIKENQGWGSYTVQPEAPLESNDGSTSGGSGGNGKRDPHEDDERPGQKKRTPIDPLLRKTPIASKTHMKIEHHRLLRMFKELKAIDCDEFPNAAAVLTRVFIEGCVDVFAESAGLTFSTNTTLAQKTNQVRKHLLDSNPDNQSRVKSDLRGLEAFHGEPTGIGSANTFNAVVHNANFSLTPKELKIVWERLEPCLQWFEGKV